MRSNQPSVGAPTPADAYGYWPGAGSRRHSEGHSKVAMVVVALLAGLIWVGSGARVPSTIPVGAGMTAQLPRKTTGVSPLTLTDANGLTRMSNDRVAVINQADQAFKATPRTVADQKREFVTLLAADTAFRDRLTAAKFKISANEDLRALLTAVNRLVISETLVARAADDSQAAEGFKQFLDAEASEEASLALLTQHLR